MKLTIANQAVVHAFNPGTWEAEVGGVGGRYLCEFKAILTYRASSRTGMAVTRRNPVSKTKKMNSCI